MDLSSAPNDDDDLVTVFSLAEGGTNEMEVQPFSSSSNPMASPRFWSAIRRCPTSPRRSACESDAERAEQIIADALAMGPKGASEAEAEGENKHSNGKPRAWARGYEPLFTMWDNEPKLTRGV